MTPNEKSLIEDLFSRIRSNGVPYRDAEADALIGQQMTATPGAAYALAQTVLVQDQALRAANARIQALEAAQQQQGTGGGSGGSFLGGAAQQAQAAPQPGRWNQQQAAPQGPWGGAPQGAPQGQPGYAPAPQPEAGGGFLRSAVQTAAGVAGGALLFEGIRSLFHGGGFGGGGFGGGLGGFGGGFGGNEPTVVEETVVNNYGNADQDDNSFAGNDPNVTNADWQSDDGFSNDSFDDDNSFDNGDGSSWA